MNAAANDPSWYAASAGERPSYARLTGRISCDVAVVGGGICGLSAALDLAARGYRTVVLERDYIGAGASGRSGGQVLPGFACSAARLQQLVGRDDARRLWRLSRAAVSLTRQRIVLHGIECDWRTGHLDTALKRRQVRELAATKELLARDFDDHACEWLEGATLAREIASERYLAGLYDAAAGHLHPLKYIVGLARAAQAAGAAIYEQSAVLKLERGTQPRLRTAQADVEARYVVVAQNCARPALVPALARRIMPVGTYIVASVPLGAERAARLLPRDAGVCDINFVLDYFRRSADHRMLFGGRVSYSGLTPPRLAPSMRARMARVFPELADIEIEYAWGGEVDISLNRAPDFGTLDGNLLYAQGFSGHGMALAGLAGQVLAEAIAGQAERLDVFSHIRHRDFPGGPWLRMPALVLGTLYYRLRDWL
jgi:gamma-glutamylputrescine oxidase